MPERTQAVSEVVVFHGVWVVVGFVVGLVAGLATTWATAVHFIGDPQDDESPLPRQWIGGNATT